MPTDYTSTAFKPMVAVYSFSIFVEPCIITDFTTVPISKVVYKIGSNDEISESYSFTQQPACNYNVIISIMDLPAFATHQESS